MIPPFADSGTIMIGTEFFTYTSKDDTNNTFNGITRGAFGSTAATHGL